MKTKILLAGAIVLFGAAFGATSASAYPGGWVMLGERIVSDHMDRDEIYLPGHARYAQIKICVYRNPIRVFDVDVWYENGQHQDISVRHHIEDGECTRNIDLDGRRRDIRNIRMVYEETSWGHRRSATVRVFGR